jgi:hypothetical protein
VPRKWINADVSSSVRREVVPHWRLAVDVAFKDAARHEIREATIDLSKSNSVHRSINAVLRDPFFARRRWLCLEIQRDDVAYCPISGGLAITVRRSVAKKVVEAESERPVRRLVYGPPSHPTATACLAIHIVAP